jgi:hypothetical protein
MWTITQSPPTKQVDGAYPSVNKTLSLLERLEVTPSIQTTKNIEEHFLKIDEEIWARAGFYEGNSDSDEDMSRSALGREVYTYIPDNLEDISGEDLLQQFEILSIDNNSLGLYEEPQHAPTLEYVSPQLATADLGHDQFVDQEAEIDVEWKSKNPGPLKHKTSNEVVHEAWKHHQDYLATLNHTPTPGLPSDFDDGLKEALDWGSDEELKYASTSFHTLDTNTSTVLAHSSNEGKGILYNMLIVKEVSKLYNVNFGALENLQCEHKILLLQCAECRQKVSSLWLLDSGASAHLMLRLVGRSVRRARDGVILKSTTNKGGLP